MHLTDIQRGMILGAYLSLKSIRAVCKLLKFPRSTVQYWIQRYEQTNTVERRFSSGRPRITSVRTDRILYRLARANGFATASDLLRHWQLGVSKSTLLRRLHERNLHQFRPRHVPLLTKEQKRARLDWTMRRCHWRAQWKRVIWSDESRFLLHPVSGRTLVWRFPGEQLNDNLVIQVTQAGGGSVHVWGAIWKGGRSELVRLVGTVNAHRYCEILHEFFTATVLPDHSVFQQDNAPAHRSWITSQLLEDVNIRLLPWPAHSPDLNPIEHVWDILGRRMQGHACQSLNQLFGALREEWHAIPQEDLDDLIGSMPRRVGEVISKKGGHTRY